MTERLTPVLAPLLAPFAASAHTVRHYSLGKFRRDLVAGLTVSVVEVPQAMAYALIAGVPPQYGIYTSIIQGFVGALLSSSEHMTTGPTNTQSLLIASAIAGFEGLSPERYLELVFALALLKGLIQLAFAVARMGDLVRFVSRSVIVGLAAGAGVLIVIGQLANFLGVRVPRGDARFPGIIGQLEQLWPHMPATNWRAVAIGIGVLVLVVGLRKISRFVPGALIAVVASAVAVWALSWHDAVRVIGALPEGFVRFHVPQFSFADAREIVGGALALAILGMIECVAIAKSIAAKSGERINPNQEFFAQGFMNSLTSFFQCIPGSGSFTRSALDYEAGAATRFAAVMNAGFVAAIYFLFAGGAKYIPLASLAAVLFVVAWGLVDFKHIARIFRTSRSDAVVCAITFLSTLLAPLEYAIFVGIFLNIALYVRTASRLQVAEIVQTPEGPFAELDGAGAAATRDITLLQLEGNLFFALADELETRLLEVQRSSAKVVILRMKRTHAVDATILGVLDAFVTEMRRGGRHVLFCGVKQDLMGRMTGYGLLSAVGPENVFASTSNLFAGTREALARAQALLAEAAAPQSPPTEREGAGFEI